jgi:hypothetical protein
MVEDMQRKAVDTAQLVASDEGVPDVAASGDTSGKVAAIVGPEQRDARDAKP